VAGLAASVFFNLFGLVILLFCVQFFVQPLSIHIIALPIIWLPLLLLTCGLSWVVAALGVLVRDVGQLIVILLQVLFYLCPIVYPLARVPVSMQRIYMLLNPMAIYVEQTRAVVLDRSWPQWNWMPQSYLISLVAFIFGYYVFMRAKRGFADVI
jgi:lipopolysaccharide transport system permease protein